MRIRAKKTKCIGMVVLAVFLLLVPGSVYAVSITYDTTDLINITPEEDLWQYTYYFRDFFLEPGSVFEMFFSGDQYAESDVIETLPLTEGKDWAQGESIIISEDGDLYDTLQDWLTYNDYFMVRVNVIWQGLGPVPGSQPFEIYNVNPTLPAISGFTKPVPEPATLLLIGAGLVGLAGIRRKLKK